MWRTFNPASPLGRRVSAAGQGFNTGGGPTPDPDVLLLLPCTGVDESPAFPDSALGGNAPHTTTAQGDCQVDTAIADPFGANNGVMFLDGNDWLEADDDPDWVYAADLTVETFIRFTALPANGSAAQFYSQYIDGNQFTQLYVYNNAGTYQLTFYVYDFGEIALVNGNLPALSVDTWYHAAAVRDGNEWDNFWEGASVANITAAGAIPNFATPLNIGRHTAGSSYLNGQLSNYRISKKAWYPGGTTFVVPTAPFTPYL